MLEQKIEQDLKRALLARDAFVVSTLRGLKNALAYAKAPEHKTEPLADEIAIGILRKEASKRQESADLYEQGGDKQRAAAELKEKAIIRSYLPPEPSEVEIAHIIDKVVNEQNLHGAQAIGQVIAAVKLASKGMADGAVAARLAKERLAQ